MGGSAYIHFLNVSCSKKLRIPHPRSYGGDGDQCLPRCDAVYPVKLPLPSSGGFNSPTLQTEKFGSCETL